MKMVKTIDVLRANEAQSPSKWKADAQWRRSNWPWLKHSYKIAIACRAKMREAGITQVVLADRMGCSQQYVSLILQGKENLTLETISRLETALSIDLLSINSSAGVDYQLSNNTPQYLSDAETRDYNSDCQ